MTEQLKKIFGDMSRSLSQQVKLKVEPSFHNENLGPDEKVTLLIEDNFDTKKNEATAFTEVEIPDHGEIFKEELVLLKITEILKTEPTFRKEPNSEKSK